MVECYLSILSFKHLKYWNIGQPGGCHGHRHGIETAFGCHGYRYEELIDDTTGKHQGLH